MADGWRVCQVVAKSRVGQFAAANDEEPRTQRVFERSKRERRGVSPNPLTPLAKPRCVSQSNIEIVREYIRKQVEHHATQSFQDKLRKWLRRYKIEWDELY